MPTVLANWCSAGGETGSHFAPGDVLREMWRQWA
jgi:hypothetical protein